MIQPEIFENHNEFTKCNLVTANDQEHTMQEQHPMRIRITPNANYAFYFMSHRREQRIHREENVGLIDHLCSCDFF